MAIAVSRQLGSGGSRIGYEVAKELSFKYADSEALLKAAARRIEVEAAGFEEYDDHGGSTLHSLLGWCSFSSLDSVASLAIRPPVHQKDLFSMECKIVRELIAHYDAVIVGRATLAIPRDRPRVLRVFIHASPKFRAGRAARSHFLPLKDARANVEKSDKLKIKFAHEATGIDWADAGNYNLCIDASVVGFSAAVEMILWLVHSLQNRAISFGSAFQHWLA